MCMCGFVITHFLHGVLQAELCSVQDQYFFVHEAVAEALLCGNTEVSLDSLPGYIDTLCTVIPDDETESTNLELEFKVRMLACLY